MRTYKLYKTIYPFNPDNPDLDNVFEVCSCEENIKDVVPTFKDRIITAFLGEFNSKESLETLLTAFYEKYKLKDVNDGVLSFTCSLPNEYFLDIQDKLIKENIQNHTDFIMEMVEGNKVMQPVPAFI